MVGNTHHIRETPIPSLSKLNTTVLRIDYVFVSVFKLDEHIKYNGASLAATVTPTTKVQGDNNLRINVLL